MVTLDDEGAGMVYCEKDAMKKLITNLQYFIKKNSDTRLNVPKRQKLAFKFMKSFMDGPILETNASDITYKIP